MSDAKENDVCGRIPEEAGAAFGTPAPDWVCEPLVRGHLHRTFVVRPAHDDGRAGRRILQDVNTTVFSDPDVLMRNIVLVTGHLRRVAPARRHLTLVPTTLGAPYAVVDGRTWRMFEYLEGTTTHEVCADEAVAYGAGVASGEFLTALEGLDPAAVGEVIPGFHDGASRFAALVSATRRDAAGRARDARGVTARISSVAPTGVSLTEALRRGVTRRRVTHNDNKLNNVLFDVARPASPVALVDLDTCMPGTALYDFGDLVRSVAVRGREDDPAAEVDDAFVRAATAGFMEGTGGSLNEAERALLPTAPAAMAAVLAARFLTDHLDGDAYFPVAYPGHNLVRAEAQCRAAEGFLALAGRAAGRGRG